ncbi:RES family NAD+ phosphorylase [Endothiovibrio diazotrophicus]
MLAFRVADRRHPIFDGTGAALRGARWNSPGRPVIYASDTLAGAMLEVLAHLHAGPLPKNHAYIRIGIPDDLAFETVTPEQLPQWHAPESPAARRRGDLWLEQGETCLLRVPSVIVPEGFNILINPLHPKFPTIRASSPLALSWDERLFESA